MRSSILNLWFNLSKHSKMCINRPINLWILIFWIISSWIINSILIHILLRNFIIRISSSSKTWISVWISWISWSWSVLFLFFPLEKCLWWLHRKIPFKILTVYSLKQVTLVCRFFEISCQIPYFSLLMWKRSQSLSTKMII
jgi:hypothetical protein